MSIKPDYRLEIKCTNPQLYTLNAVVNSPRTAMPMDVATACDNLEVVTVEPEPPESITSIVKYILGPFFSVAHRTGLYNRQKGLWESIARVSDIDVFRIREGFFQKKELAQWEIYFTDSKKRVLLYAYVVEPPDSPQDQKQTKELLKMVQHRAEKLKAIHPTIAGVMLAVPEPCPEAMFQAVLSLTGGDDPIGRYELLLPEPLAVPLDVLEYADAQAVRLLLPDLESKARK